MKGMSQLDNNSKNILVGNLACFAAYFIFGFNIVFCKNIANCGMVSPIALFSMRALGAFALFEICSLFKHDHERIALKDMWKVALASFLGLFLTQLSFLKAVTMATAIDVSILSILSPIMAMIVGTMFMRDKITLKGILGLGISVAGVLFLIFNTTVSGGGASHTSIGGILLMLVNTLSFALYVALFKPLIQRYSVVCFMKWMFLFSALFALPFGAKDLLNINYSAIPADIVLQILYVVVFATFVSYFLIPIGQKRIPPVVVCMYSYVQPVMALAISIAMGLDTMSWAKAIAAILVFMGVGIVNFSNHKRR